MCADWFFMFLWYRDHTAYYAERIFTIGWCGNKYSWDVYRMGDMEDRMQVSQNMCEWKVLILSRNNFLEFQYSICGEYRAFGIIAADIYDEEPFWCDRCAGKYSEKKWRSDENRKMDHFWNVSSFACRMFWKESSRNFCGCKSGKHRI